MGKVLFILGSHDELLDGKGKTGWYLPEAAHPYYEVSPHHEVVWASLKGGEAPLDPNSVQMFKDDEGCKKFQADEKAQQGVKNTLKLADINVKDFDGVFAVGGHAPMWDEKSPIMQGKLAEFYSSGKLVSAVCHGPAVLTSVVDKDGKPILTRKKVTGFSNEEEEQVGLTKAVPFLLEDRFDEIGARFEKAKEPWGAHVVVDGQIITGQNPNSAEGVGKAIVEYLSKQK